jgi:hypothetical protein
MALALADNLETKPKRKDASTMVVFQMFGPGDSMWDRKYMFMPRCFLEQGELLWI